MRERLRRLRDRVLAASVASAVRRQGLRDLYRRLETIVPDLSDQYSHTPVADRYYRTKVRGLHAFEVDLVGRAIAAGSPHTIVDIGDSSGTHLRYIREVYALGDDVTTLSVNLDPAAVGRIRAKGMEALCVRAEDLASEGVDAQLFVCFETLEHLGDPAGFLHSLASRTSAERLVLTVPYVRDSRVGLDHIRRGRAGRVTAEDAHIFELDPADWRLLALHAGWRTEQDRVYLQYPRFSPLCLTRAWWKRYDFEGFYGMVLTRDGTWSSRYADWRS